MKRLRTHLPRMRALTRRQRVIYGGSVAIIVIAGYVAWSVMTWSRFSATNNTRFTEVRAQVDAALAMPTDSAEKKSEKLRALQAATKEFTDTQHSVCTVNAGIGWQEVVIPDYKNQRDKCSERMAKVQSFIASLEKTTLFLAEEQSFTDSITGLRPSTTDALADSEWQGRLQQVTDILASVEKLSVSSESEPIKTKVVATLQSIKTAWEEVIAASAATDRTSYESAVGKLGTAYGNLETIDAATSEAFNPLVTDLVVSYDAAFINI